MTNFHAKRGSETATRWTPVAPPQRGRDRTAFHTYMLLPGLSVAFHSETLKRCRSSIANYRKQAVAEAALNPTIMEGVESALSELRPDHGMQMARIRGTAQLPYWARLAILEYRKRGFRLEQIAAMFCCSRGTVANVLHGKSRGYEVFSGERRLTLCQRQPPNRWLPKKPEK